MGGPSHCGCRLALDQGVFAPIFISVFVSSLLTLEGNASQILAKLRQDLGGAVVANWKIWVPANFINFRCGSKSYRGNQGRLLSPASVRWRSCSAAAGCASVRGMASPDTGPGDNP